MKCGHYGMLLEILECRITVWPKIFSQIWLQIVLSPNRFAYYTLLILTHFVILVSFYRHSLIANPDILTHTFEWFRSRSWSRGWVTFFYILYWRWIYNFLFFLLVLNSIASFLFSTLLAVSTDDEKSNCGKLQTLGPMPRS